MRSRWFVLVLALCVAGCARLDVLTEENLSEAETTWLSHAPGFYRVVVEMSGTRIETGIFEVLVREGQVVSLKRNGVVVLPERGEDYSIKGLYRMLHQELALAQQPALLGAPPGYSAHPLVRFDRETGRLERYRRTVGGIDNNVEITVLEFEPQ